MGRVNWASHDNSGAYSHDLGISHDMSIIAGCFSSVPWLGSILNGYK